jgi:3-deoxy-D-manno-octulosonic-acid transferase
MGRNFAEQEKRMSGRPIIMFASSRQGEEAMLFQALVANKNLTQGVQWLVVPRHPQRFEEVAKLATQFGFTVAKRTSSNSSQFENSSHKDLNYFEQLTPLSESLPVIWLGNTVGEMHLYYGMSKVALLGGSFEPLGGQNLIEAAACACPVVMGPHVYNFSQAAEQSIDQGAAVQKETVQGACQSALEIASNMAIQKRMADAALAFTEQNKGALSKTLKALAPYLS